MPQAKRAQTKPERVDWPQTGLATIYEACQFLRVSRTTLYKLMDADELKYKPVRGDRRISWKLLHKFADS